MQKQSMAKWSGKRGLIIPLLLLASLTLNIFALILPFIEINEALHSTVIYSLPHSVKLMWEHQLYAVSLLILGFSIIFPFVKLISLNLAWLVPWDAKRRTTFIHLIELLGKWSFMDIFVVILLLALTSNQAFIHSKIHIGVYFFIAAITLSMLLSQIIFSIARKMEQEQTELLVRDSKRHWLLIENIYLGWTVPVLTFIAIAALLQALHAPFLKISQFLLASHSYSISETATTLHNNGQVVLYLVMAGTLAVIPITRLILLMWTWIIPMKIKTHAWMNNLAEGLSRWSMLDVFGLALFLVTTEGKDLVKTEILPGLYVVLVAIGLCYFLGFLAFALHKTMVRSEETTATS